MKLNERYKGFSKELIKDGQRLELIDRGRLSLLREVNKAGEEILKELANIEGEFQHNLTQKEIFNRTYKTDVM